MRRRVCGTLGTAVVGAALALLPVTLPTASAAPTTPPPTSPPAARVPVLPSIFTFTGSGWGHGIGLSQSGAYGMAVGGATATQILTHYYTGVTVRGWKDDVDLRVSVAQQQRAVRFSVATLTRTAAHLEVAVDGIVKAVGGPADVFTAAIATGRITVSRTTGGVSAVVGAGSRVAVRWSGTRTSHTTGRVPGVVRLESGDAAPTSSSPTYRYGWFDIFGTPAQPSTLEVVNPVRLHDEYLYGIGEVPSSWPQAALAAQVVAARSFAVTKLSSTRTSCGCQIYGDTRDQNFVGYGKLAEGSWGARWKQAVDATAVDATHGLTVQYRQHVIPAYYGDSTGGRTQNNEDVWGGTPLPWARSVDDHWSLDPRFGGSFASWRPRVRTQAAVAAAFGLADVRSVRVRTRFLSGGAATVIATSGTGVSVILSGERFRSRLALPSTWIHGVSIA